MTWAQRDWLEQHIFVVSPFIFIFILFYFCALYLFCVLFSLSRIVTLASDPFPQKLLQLSPSDIRSRPSQPSVPYMIRACRFFYAWLRCSRGSLLRDYVESMFPRCVIGRSMSLLQLPRVVLGDGAHGSVGQRFR